MKYRVSWCHNDYGETRYNHEDYENLEKAVDKIALMMAEETRHVFYDEFELLEIGEILPIEKFVTIDMVHDKIVELLAAEEAWKLKALEDQRIAQEERVKRAAEFERAEYLRLKEKFEK